MTARLAGTLISGAVLSKLLGFVREMEMGRLVGASLVADSFRGAMTAVLLPIAPLQSDSVPSVLIPMHRDWGGAAPQRSGALLVLVACIGIAAALAVSLLAAPWVGLLVAQFDATAQELTVRFVRIMSLALPASIVSSILAPVEIATGRSRIASLRASVQNIGMMAGIAVFGWTGQPLAIAWAFVVSFNLVAAYGLVLLGREGAITLRGVGPATVGAVGLGFWRRFRPLLGVPVAEQGNIFLERMLASGIAVGALASLDYARTLTETAFYLVSQPIGYIVLTRTAGRAQDVPGEVGRISTRLLALGTPMSVFVVLFAPDIVTIVFARGAFDAHAVMLTAGAMRGIAAGLWAAMLGWVLVRMLNAAGRHAMSATVVVGAFAANALFNAVAVSRLGTLGLGLGEAVRGLVLLGGTAIALGCVGPVMLCVARAAAVALPLGLAGLLVLAWGEAAVPRLLVAVPLFGVATAVWLGVVLPDQRRWVAARLRRPVRLPSRG